MIEIPKPNSDNREIAKLLKSYGAGVTCYAISCIPGKLAFFEAEQEVLPSPRFILKR